MYKLNACTYHFAVNFVNKQKAARLPEQPFELLRLHALLYNRKVFSDSIVMDVTVSICSACSCSYIY